MSYSPSLGGMAGPSGFSPADFADAEEMRPIGAVFDVGGHGVSNPYSAAVTSIIHKHTYEIKRSTAEKLNMPAGWKKRLREFMTTKNNDLLDFLKLSAPSHPTLGAGEVLLRRFGNPQVSPSHASVRDIVFDVSGEDVLSDLEVAMKVVHKEGILKDYANQTRVIYEEYSKAGDEILTQQNALKVKLEKLDRIQGRVTNLFEIDPNEKYEPLMISAEEYLKKIYEENKIEEEYKKLIQAYRRFAMLRDVVTMSRSLLAQESEPICSICLNESVAYTLTPCGHTFCQTCVRRQSGQCFMCRVPIRDKVKLYFG